MGIKYTYDGVEHSVEGNSTTLTTKNKLCKTDIEIEYDGIVPSGTININTNGNHNVANYETANVNVPNGTETKNITQNGTYTPTSPNIGFSQVVVNVPEQKEEQTKTLTLGSQTPQTVNPDSGKVLAQVPVVIDNTVIKAENIKKDVVMLGITGTHEGGGNLKDISPITENGIYKVFDDLIIVDSLKGNGIAYFPTDIILNDSTSPYNRYEIEVCLIVGGTSSGYVYGCKGTGIYTYNFYMFDYGSGGVQLINGYYEFYPSYTITAGSEITYITDGEYLYINGVKKNSQGTAKYFTNPTPLYIFASNSSSTPNNIFHDSSFKYLKIKNSDGKLIYHFVPCRTSNNVPKILEKKTMTVYDATGDTTGMTFGIDVEDLHYDGFKSPIQVNVNPMKWGATLDDMFNGSVPAIPTLHDVVIPASTLTPLQRVFRYSTIKSFTITSPFSSNAQYDYVYAVANTPYLETINIQRGVSWSNSSTNWQHFAYQSTGLKHLSVNGLVGSASNSFTQMFCYCTNLEDVVWYFNPNAPYFQYTNQFNNTFMHCHKLTKITFSGLVRSNGNATNVFNYCFGECYASFDEDINHFRFPNLEYIGITTGTSNHSNFKYAFTSSDSSYYGKCSLIFPEMYAIYNRNATATYGHFAYCNALGKIYLPKLTNDGTTGQNIFNNCPYLTEIHFGIENQATVQALNGYASKFGATNATLYFDLVNHITVNGVVYDRSGAEYDYDTSHYSWKNGNDIYYTTNALTPQVGDTVYTKDIHGRYIASQYTITAIA